MLENLLSRRYSALGALVVGLLKLSALTGPAEASLINDPQIGTTVPAGGTTAPAGKDSATDNITVEVKNTATGKVTPVAVTVTVNKGTDKEGKLQAIADGSNCAALEPVAAEPTGATVAPA